MVGEDRRMVTVGKGRTIMLARLCAAAALLICFVARAGCQELPLDGNQATAALSFNPAADPFGNVDTYKLLQQADIEGQWSKDDGRNATEKMEELLSFSSVLHVDIKLVGFEGDGSYGLKVDEADFLRYFETVLEEHEKVCFRAHVASTNGFEQLLKEGRRACPEGRVGDPTKINHSRSPANFSSRSACDRRRRQWCSTAREAGSPTGFL